MGVESVAWAAAVLLLFYFNFAVNTTELNNSLDFTLVNETMRICAI